MIDPSLQRITLFAQVSHQMYPYTTFERTSLRTRRGFLNSRTSGMTSSFPGLAFSLLKTYTKTPRSLRGPIAFSVTSSKPNKYLPKEITSRRLAIMNGFGIPLANTLVQTQYPSYNITLAPGWPMSATPG